MKRHVNKVGSYWLELEEALGFNESNEGKSDKSDKTGSTKKKKKKMLWPLTS